MRLLARLPLILLLAIVTVLLAGCGSDDSSSSKSSSTSDRSVKTDPGDDDAPAGKVKAVEAKLEISLEKVGARDGAGIPVPGGIRCTKSIPATCGGTLECPVAEGADESAIELCAWLATSGRSLLLDEPDQAMACTQQYGGPEIATVTGTLDGEQVNATFSREDGCAISRFDDASPLWTGEVSDAAAEPATEGGAPTDVPNPTTAPPTEPEIISDPPEAFE